MATYEIQQVTDLLSLLLDDAKNSLTTCAADDFARLQGEAQTYDKLLRMISRPTIKTLVNKE